jgi:hypothetical protein
VIAAVVPLLCLAADPAWNPADAAKEAKQAIRVGHIKFYWAGSVGVGRVGVSIKVRKSIQGLMPELAVSQASIPLRERQEEYARWCNEKVYGYVLQKH